MGEVIALRSQPSRNTVDERERRLRLGRMIRHARGEVTQAQLAMALGVGQPAISAWEAGRVRLTSEQLYSIETALGREHGWLSVAAGFVTPSLDALMVLLEASVAEALRSRAVD